MIALRLPTNWLVRAALLIAAGTATPACLAQTDDQSLAHKVKTVYLYRISQFTQWPEHKSLDDAGEFHLCSAHNSAMEHYLRTLADKKLKNRTITVSTVHSATEVSQCHLLFMPSNQPELHPAFIAASTEHHILTVGDSEGFVEAGGMIGFVIDEGRIRFEINLRAIEAAHLKPSAKVLELATAVIGARIK